jgi:hypothetical protein
LLIFFFRIHNINQLRRIPRTTTGTPTPMAIFAEVERSLVDATGKLLGEGVLLVEAELEVVEVDCELVEDLIEVAVLCEASNSRISVSLACQRTCISSTHAVGAVTVAMVTDCSVGFVGIGPASKVFVI